MFALPWKEVSKFPWLVEMTSSFSRSASLNRNASFKLRALSVGSPRISRGNVVSRLCIWIVVIGALISFLIALTACYFYSLPNLTFSFHGYGLYKSNSSATTCDVYNGNWVVDENYPLYNAGECPFAEKGFDCLSNGRRDEDYLKWRWKPMNCDIGRFNVHQVLEMFRNKRIVFVGDSMSRTQWESLICLLMSGVEDKKSVYEINGNQITKTIRFLGVRFNSFNFTVEFYRSVFLVQHNWSLKNQPKKVKSALKLDKLDSISSEWIDSNVLIFNSGHWWVPGKLFDTGCYFQVGNSINLGMPIHTAFRIALETWASWVEQTIDTNKTRVFFRTFEPSHWSGHTYRTCNVTSQPAAKTLGREENIFSNIIMEVVNNMTVPINVMDITPLSAKRTDAHVGKWSDNPAVPDCSHWCLPGVPDTWNEILLFLLSTGHLLHPS